MLIGDNGYFNINSFISFPSDSYEDLREEALACTNCHLREKCTQVVMGEGSLKNKIMLVGEGPGATEDKQGRPFVGRAGRLLDKMLAAIDVSREDVYISNIVKCRPPENRKPTRDEARACAPILKAEIELIQPKVIVPMGATAFQYLINDGGSITESRGNWFERGPYYIFPTYHPAYLLRNKNMKKPAWEDFKVIRKAIDRIQELKRKGQLA